MAVSIDLKSISAIGRRMFTGKPDRLEKRMKRSRVPSPSSNGASSGSASSGIISLSNGRSSLGPGSAVSIGRGDARHRREQLSQQMPLVKGMRVAFRPPNNKGGGGGGGGRGHDGGGGDADDQTWILAEVTSCFKEDKKT